jgi:hypothetical protein
MELISHTVIGNFSARGFCVSRLLNLSGVNTIHDQKYMLYSVYSTSIVVTCRRDSASHCESPKKLSVAYHAV